MRTSRTTHQLRILSLGFTISIIVLMTSSLPARSEDTASTNSPVASTNAEAIKETQEFNNKCFSCHIEQRTDCRPIIPDEFAVSGHGRKNLKCTVCHANYTDKAHPLTKYKYDPENYDQYLKLISDKCKSCHKNIFTYEPYDKKAYPRSIHKKVKCEDCHDFVPNIHRQAQDSNYIKKAHSACERCHRKQANAYDRSRHAQARQKGKRAPDCVMCHGSHWTQSLKKRAKTAAFKNLMLEYCSECHPHRTSSGNFHFQAVKLGYSSVPSCYNCHGAHDNEHLVKNAAETISVCRRCHKKERLAFFDISIHGLKRSKMAMIKSILWPLFDWRTWLLIVFLAIMGSVYVFRIKKRKT